MYRSTIGFILYCQDSKYIVKYFVKIRWVRTLCYREIRSFLPRQSLTSIPILLGNSSFVMFYFENWYLHGMVQDSRFNLGNKINKIVSIVIVGCRINLWLPNYNKYTHSKRGSVILLFCGIVTFSCDSFPFWSLLFVRSIFQLCNADPLHRNWESDLGPRIPTLDRHNNNK